MITSNNPEMEKRRQLLLLLQYHSAQMDVDDLARLLRIMERANFLRHIDKRLPLIYVRWQCRRWALALARA